jgi:hypothetical protein
MHDMRGCIAAEVPAALDAAGQYALWSAQYMFADDSGVFLAGMWIHCMVACECVVQMSTVLKHSRRADRD